MGPPQLNPSSPYYYYYYYTRPYPELAGQLVLLVLGILGLTSRAVYGHKAPISYDIWIVFFTVQLVDVFTDPETFVIRKTMEDGDGAEVRVKRPLIGFRWCEQLLNETPEEYDGLPGEWRFGGRI